MSGSTLTAAFANYLSTCVLILILAGSCTKSDCGYSTTPLFNAADLRFMNQESAYNFDEIAAGNLAETSATTPSIQSFGLMTVEDRDSAQQQLKAA
ncbi:MAG TPA: DUF4142 domain-containing protein, partial [Puia sp.]|nr:DUF4142 domain-containing protein [Puia sp.]